MSWRYSSIQVGFGLLFFVICLRLGQIMVVDHNDYQVLAAQQHVIQQTIDAKRGEIFTSDGYPLVANTEGFLLFAVPKEMKDKKEVVELLAKNISTLILTVPLNETHIHRVKIDATEPSPSPSEAKDPEETELPLPATLHLLRHLHPEWQVKDFEKSLEKTIGRLLEDENNQFVQVVAQLTPDDKNILEGLSLKGLHFQQQSKRSYPEGTMAAHALGIVGKDSKGLDQGYFGIEGYYDADLSGKPGYRILERDVAGKQIPYGRSLLKDASHGRDFVLTIQRELQYLLEKNLEEGVKKTKAQSGTAVLLDPYSGAVWGMANYPAYNPEFWTEILAGESDVSKVELLRNLAISENYEPGSVMKPITMSMALNESVVTPETPFKDAGPVEYSGYQVRTWNNKYYDNINMIQVLQLSHNTGAAWVGHQLGFNRFGSYIDTFRFGRSTGIDLQGEEFGIVRERSEWRDIDLANMAFGQGISVTSLQMAAAFTSLINGGTLYQPRIVDKIYDYRGDLPVEIKLEPNPVGSVVKEKTSETLRLMLQKVVTDGEFKWYVQQSGMHRYNIGGKTGTAQIPVDGRYDPNKTNTTFIGFAPVDQPRFVLLMKLSQPGTSTYSADTVVPMWMNTAKELMYYYKIQPN